MLNVFIFVLTAYAVYNILKYFGVFETNVGIPKLSNEVKLEKEASSKRNIERKKLRLYSQTCEYFRILAMPDSVYRNHRYFIDRLEIRSDILDRTLTPEEVRGKYLLLVVIGVLVTPIGVIFPLVWAFTGASIALFMTYTGYYMQKISDEDEIIDIYFLDLYLLMYSRLRMGSKARLQSVVESYIETLNTSANLEMRAVMLKFSRFLLNNLSMYEDHMAIQHLRDRYRSATIINFCNVGSQALQGVDNGDTLLTFKMDLVRKKTDAMKQNAEVSYQKGNRSIYLIYIILFIFIGAGWMSKLPVGMMPK